MKSVQKAVLWRALALAVAFMSFAGGTAQAKLSISEGGQPNYIIPIPVPPGIGGMEPNLTLQYSGDTRGDWGVSGLSVISRCPATKATDGYWGAVKYDANDKLCLDGQRMILTDASGNPVVGQGGYGTGAGEYRLEKDNFSRIRAYGGSSGTGPQYFKVWTKAGQTYEYGNTTDSRIEAYGTSAISVWAVNRIADTVGNFMTIGYSKSAPTFGGSAGGSWEVTQIRYTGNGSQAPTFRVDFAYESRADAREHYQWGSKSVTDRRLSAVRTYASTAAGGSGGIKVNTMKLHYTASGGTGNSIVDWIQSCAGTAETACLPRVEFFHTDGSNFNYSLAQPSSLTGMELKRSNRSIGVILGDFNGDGRQDFIRWDDSNGANNKLMLSNGDGSFSEAGGSNLGMMLGHRRGCAYTRVADFNMDGISDILVVTDPGFNGNGVNCGPDVSYSANIYLGSSSGAFSGAYPLNIPLANRVANKFAGGCDPVANPYPWCANGVYMIMSGRNFYIADVNGDGVPDIIGSKSSPGEQYENGASPCSSSELTCIWLGSRTNIGNYTKLATNLADQDIYSPDAGTVPWYSAYKDNLVFVGDLTGDGLADILIRDTGIRYIALGGSGTYQKLTGNPQCTVGAEVLDVNGDGKWDIACLDLNTTGSMKAYVNDGTGAMMLRGPVGPFVSRPENCPRFEPPPGDESGNPPSYCATWTDWNTENISYMAADLNGDGVSDILAIGRYKNANGANVNAVLRGNKDGTYTPVSTAFDGAAMGWHGDHEVLIGDFRGSGTPDFLRISNTSANNGIFLRSHPGAPDRMGAFKSTTNETTSINYKLMNDASVYTRETGSSGDVVDVMGTAYVVSSVSEPDGVGGTSVVNYRYGGLRAKLDGRGSLGFRQRDVTANAFGSDLTTRTTVRQDYPFVGLPEETRTFLQGMPSQWITLSTAAYDDLHNIGCPVSGTPRIYRAVLSGKNDKRRAASASGPYIETQTTNSSFTCIGGDPGNVSVTTVGDSKTFTKATVHSYLTAVTSGDSWTMGRLVRSEITSTVPNTTQSSSAGINPVGVTEINPNPVTVHKSLPGTATATVHYRPPSYDPSLALVHVWSTAAGARISIASTAPAPHYGDGLATVKLSAELGWSEDIQETLQLKTTDFSGESRVQNVPLHFTSAPQPQLSLSSPPPLVLSRTTNGTVSATVSAASLGTAPFTFTWARLTGSRLAFSPAGATNTFSAYMNGTPGSFTETFRVTSVDSASVVRTLDFAVFATGPSDLAVSLSLPSPQEHYDVEPPWSVIEEVEASVSGGVGPYVVTWEVISGRASGALIETSLALQEGTWNMIEVPVTWGDSFTDVVRVWVTDSEGTQRFTDLEFICNGLYAD